MNQKTPSERDNRIAIAALKNVLKEVDFMKCYY